MRSAVVLAVSTKDCSLLSLDVSVLSKYNEGMFITATFLTAHLLIHDMRVRWAVSHPPKD